MSEPLVGGSGGTLLDNIDNSQHVSFNNEASGEVLNPKYFEEDEDDELEIYFNDSTTDL
jgi:hypothetical protein